MICLVDNDIIYKLAMCNLLDDTLTALDSARTDAYVLPTAKYKFGVARRRSGTGKQRYGAELFARIRDCLASVREIDVAGPSEELQLLAISTASMLGKPSFSQLQWSLTNICWRPSIRPARVPWP